MALVFIGVTDFRACEDAEDPLKYWVDYLFFLFPVCYYLLFNWQKY
jgi:hypothetical protein